MSFTFCVVPNPIPSTEDCSERSQERAPSAHAKREQTRAALDIGADRAGARGSGFVSVRTVRDAAAHGAVTSILLMLRIAAGRAVAGWGMDSGMPLNIEESAQGWAALNRPESRG
jgi:hypothetical protein